MVQQGDKIYFFPDMASEVLELDVDAYLDEGIDNQLDRAVEIIESKLK